MFDREIPPDTDTKMGQQHPSAAANHHHHTTVRTKPHTDIHTKNHTDNYTRHHNDNPPPPDYSSADAYPMLPLPSSLRLQSNHPLLLAPIIPITPAGKGSSPSCLLGVEAQSQSVRVAIDSFIENCLAESCEGKGGSLPLRSPPSSANESSSPSDKPSSPSYKSSSPSSPSKESSMTSRKPSSPANKPSSPSYKSSSPSYKVLSSCNESLFPSNESSSPSYKSSSPSFKPSSPSYKPSYKPSPPSYKPSSSPSYKPLAPLESASSPSSLFRLTNIDALTIPDQDSTAGNRKFGKDESEANLDDRDKQSEEMCDCDDSKTCQKSFNVQCCGRVDGSNSGGCLQNDGLHNTSLDDNITGYDTRESRRKNTSRSMPTNDDSDNSSNLSSEKNIEQHSPTLSSDSNQDKDTDVPAKACVGYAIQELSVKESSVSVEQNDFKEPCCSLQVTPGDSTALSETEKAQSDSSDHQQTKDACGGEKEAVNESKDNSLDYVQFQTIIDRMLDIPLGTVMHVNSIPHIPLGTVMHVNSIPHIPLGTVMHVSSIPQEQHFLSQTASDDVTLLSQTTSDDVTLLPQTASDDVTLLSHTASDDVTLLSQTASDDVTLLSQTASDDVTLLSQTASDDVTLLSQTASDDVTLLSQTASDDVTLLSQTASDDVTLLSQTASDDVTLLPQAASDDVTLLSQTASDDVTLLSQTASDHVTLLSQTASDHVTLPTHCPPRKTDIQGAIEQEVSTPTNENSCNKKVEPIAKIQPIAMCFVDHIEKAVESSFSYVTEEENGIEQTEANAARAGEMKGDQNCVKQSQHNEQRCGINAKSPNCSEDQTDTHHNDNEGEIPKATQDSTGVVKSNDFNGGSETDHSNCSGEVKNVRQSSPREVSSEASEKCDAETKAEKHCCVEDTRDLSQSGVEVESSEESASMCTQNPIRDGVKSSEESASMCTQNHILDGVKSSEESASMCTQNPSHGGVEVASPRELVSARVGGEGSSVCVEDTVDRVTRQSGRTGQLVAQSSASLADSNISRPVSSCSSAGVDDPQGESAASRNSQREHHHQHRPPSDPHQESDPEEHQPATQTSAQDFGQLGPSQTSTRTEMPSSVGQNSYQSLGPDQSQRILRSQTPSSVRQSLYKNISRTEVSLSLGSSPSKNITRPQMPSSSTGQNSYQNITRKDISSSLRPSPSQSILRSHMPSSVGENSYQNIPRIEISSSYLGANPSQSILRSHMPSSVRQNSYQSIPRVETSSSSLGESPSQSTFRSQMPPSYPGGKEPYPDSYLRFMGAAMARYGHRPSSVALMNTPPVTEAGGKGNTEAGGKGNSPDALKQNTATQCLNPGPGIVPRATSLRSLRGLGPQQGVLATLPPPLLKLYESEKKELLQHQESCPRHQKRHRHVSCTSCSACAADNRSNRQIPSLVNSGEKDGSQLPRQTSHYRHHPYLTSSPAGVPPFSQPWHAVRDWYPRRGQQETVYPSPCSLTPPPHHAFLSNCHPRSVHSAIPSSLFACPDMTCWESNQAYPRYQREKSRKHTRDVCQQSVHNKNGETGTGTGKVAHFCSASSVNSIRARNSVYARQPLPATQNEPKQNGCMPDINALYKQNHPVFTGKVSKEDVPLDLSTKNTNAVSSQIQQNMKYWLGESVQHHANPVSCIANKAVENETLSLANQHFYRLENSAESYFRKLQHLNEYFTGIRAAENDKSSVMPQMGRNSGLPVHQVQKLSSLNDPSQVSASYVSQNTNASNIEDRLSSQTSASLHSVNTVPSAHVEPTGVSAHRPLHAKLSPGQPLLDRQRGQPRSGLPTCLSTLPHPVYCAEYRGKGIRVVPVAPYTSALPVTPSPRIPSGSTLTPLPFPSRPNSDAVLGKQKDEMFSERRNVSSLSKGMIPEMEANTASAVSKHGVNNPDDVLYLICRLCCQTYGNVYCFRKHFLSHHGFEPKAENAIVQTISALKNSRQISDGTKPLLNAKHLLPESCFGAKLDQSPAFSSVFQAASEEGQARGLNNTLSGIQSMETKVDSDNGSSLDTREISLSASGGVKQGVAKRLKCPECEQMFHPNDFGSYKRHCRQHGHLKSLLVGGQGRLFCKACQSSFPDVGTLQDHLALHHTHRTRTEYGVCPLSFPSATPFHRYVHTTGHYISQSISSSPYISTTTLAVSTRCLPNTRISQNNIPSAMFTKSMESSCTSAINSPSDLKACQLFLDPSVTSASADSSSDSSLQTHSAHLKLQDSESHDANMDNVSSDQLPVFNNSHASSSVQGNYGSKIVQTGSEDSLNSTASQDTHTSQVLTNSSQTLLITKPADIDDQNFSEYRQFPLHDVTFVSSERHLSPSQKEANQDDTSPYKHKKFGAHRKRSGSSEASETEVKKVCYERDTTSPIDNEEQTTMCTRGQADSELVLGERSESKC